MVPDLPSLTRRRLLGGVATGVAGVAGGTYAVGRTNPTWLPDPVTDEWTRQFPTPPEVGELWRPTVTEAHAREAVEALADVVERARRDWERTETDRHFTGAGGWLENARESLSEGRYHEALFEARYGMGFAAEQLGTARARLGEADLEALARRGRDVRERARSAVSAIDPYPVVEPSRDLAWYFSVEREAMLGEHRGIWNGMDEVLDGDGPGLSSVEPWEVGQVTAGIHQGEIHVRTAERFLERHRETLDGGRTDYADHLRSVVGRFAEAVEEYPWREEVRSRYVGDEPDSDRPYEYAHVRLADWCFDTRVPVPWEEDVDDRLLVVRAVALSSALARRRAHEFAVDELVVEEDDRGFDSGHTLAEKRRARSVYRSVVGSDPPPLLPIQAGRAIEDLQVAKVGFADSYERPIWRERLKAYLYALVGRAKLREYPALHRAIVRRE